MGGRAVEGSGLENRRAGRPVPWVRIPPHPPKRRSAQFTGVRRAEEKRHFPAIWRSVKFTVDHHHPLPTHGLVRGLWRKAMRDDWKAERRKGQDCRSRHARRRRRPLAASWHGQIVVLSLTFAGKPRQMGLGTLADVPLALARDLATQARVKVNAGAKRVTGHRHHPQEKGCANAHAGSRRTANRSPAAPGSAAGSPAGRARRRRPDRRLLFCFVLLCR